MNARTHLQLEQLPEKLALTRWQRRLNSAGPQKDTHVRNSSGAEQSLKYLSSKNVNHQAAQFQKETPHSVVAYSGTKALAAAAAAVRHLSQMMLGVDETRPQQKKTALMYLRRQLLQQPLRLLLLLQRLLLPQTQRLATCAGVYLVWKKEVFREW